MFSYSLLLITFVANIFALTLKQPTVRKYQPPTFSSQSSNGVSQNTLSLKRKPGILSSRSADLQARYPKFGQQSLDYYEKTGALVTKIEIGSQTFEVVVDTGNPFTWVVETGFTCVDDLNVTSITQEDCRFGDTYTRSPTFQQFPDPGKDIIVGYMDGRWAGGVRGFDTVTLAGIQVPHQEIAVVDRAAWIGDGESSGMLGLGNPVIPAYHGINSTQDSIENLQLYNPVFTTMIQRGLTEPVFSLAISRDESNRGNAGVLTIGGTPAGLSNVTGPFASTPLMPPFKNSIRSAYYRISVEALVYQDVVSDGPVQYLVDSGTTLLLLPRQDAAALNALFKPPAYFPTGTNGMFLVRCDAVAPDLSIKIGGKNFAINPVDLIRVLVPCVAGAKNDTCSPEIQEKTCVSAIQAPFDGETFILGEMFLRNVVAIFDIGEAKMRFAGREFYAS
ncbi:MAG: hypothetical protein Q9227_005758 [Pyrenula ochraceoflavens]